ncbi:uncharacterized protein LOC143288486 [Babylonia areolata]|uniref:uncharacterized protein LOC143288486 n=1 Tax=Babylonia areolata TaxID=304850 RepID=UPI003FCF53BD
MDPCTLKILNLPENVLIQIFSNLSAFDIWTIRLTCRYFHQLSFRPDFWKHLVIDSNIDENFIHGMLSQECILPCLHEIEDVDRETSASGCATQVKGEDSPDPTPGASKVCVTHEAKKLTSVVASVEERGNVSAKYSIMGKICYPNVKKITIIRSAPFSQKNLAKYSALSSLHLENATTTGNDRWSWIDDSRQVSHLFEVLKGMKTLGTLKLVTNSKHKLAPVISKTMKDFFLSGPSLKKLYMDLSLKDSCVRNILDNCVHLEDLELHCSDLTAKAFRNVVRKPHSMLSGLKLIDCPELCEKCFPAIAAGFPNLKELGFTVQGGIGDSGSRLPLKIFPHLTVLKVHVSLRKEQKQHPSLRREDSDEDDTGEMPLSGIKTPRKMKKGNLQVLELKGFDWFETYIFSNVFLNNSDLRSVTLTNCLEVTDDCLETLAKACPQLQSVGIYKCYLVSAMGVSSLIKTLPDLESLDCFVGDSKGVFGRVLSQTSRQEERKGSKLRSLSMCPWYDITEAELMSLTSWCSNLTDLSIHGCTSLEDELVKVILRQCLGLQHLHLEVRPLGSLESFGADNILHHIETLGASLKTLVLLSNHSYKPRLLAQTVARSPALCDFTVTYPDWEEMDKRIMANHLKKELKAAGSWSRMVTFKFCRWPFNCSGHESERRGVLWFHVRGSRTGQNQVKCL